MLISIFANNPSIDANYKVKLEKESFIFFVLGKYVSIEMIELSCFMGSIKCFKYLLLNNCNITFDTAYYAVAGGNKEILLIMKEMECPFQFLLRRSVQHHRHDVTGWILNNYPCQPVPLSECILFFNFDAFYFFLRNGATFVEDESLQSPLHASCQIGHLNLTKRIVEMKYNDINIISKFFTTPFHLACFNGHLSIVKYLIAANANTEAVNNFGETPLFLQMKASNLN